VVVELVPGLEIDPALVVAGRLDEPDDADLVIDRLVEIAHPDLHVPGTQNALQ
jgi:hypothetical protein